jgi:hypothetical protein
VPKMDWKKETSTTPVYPTGTYHVRVIKHEKTTAGTGTKQLRWQAEIIAPETHKGGSIFDYTALTEAALWRTANLVAACGVDTSNSPIMDVDSASFEAILKSCHGRTLFWRNVEDKTPSGRPKNNIVDYVQDPEQPVIQPSASDIPWEA